ncbi:hypothetical protein [Pseudidiomarina donghaiensis]|uniref:RHS repeat-associated core domain-containing protein n=1 Tax=Pseudidiomarina donghaiensis TaxID=519452 RepID=A0A432XD83_9GAMM|nr:hypothetical protein [Pseudidiomarina donghaiensis]RUO46701.1 hypothetical protein CWE24_10675 [Pseudidiomarina donghaiensis]
MSVDPFVHEGSQGINPYSYMMNNPLSGTDPTGYSPEKETIELKEGDKIVQDADGNRYVDQGGDSLVKVESVSVTKGSTNVTTTFGDNGSVKGVSATNGKNSVSITDIGGQQQISVSNGGQTSNLSVSQNEWDSLAEGDLGALYKSRALKGDNVGNVGLGVWGSFKDNEDVHGFLGAIYWKSFVGSLTKLNSYAALSGDAAYFPFMENSNVKLMMAHIHNKPMAIRIAQEHLNAVQNDYNNDRTGIRGMLSERQITSYHHKVFREFNANVGRYGGTLGHGELPTPISNAVRNFSKLFYCQPACDSN